MLPVTSISRMEFIDSIPFAENTLQTLRTNGGLLPNDYFLHSLVLEFRGRLTMPATNGPSAVTADAHAGIIERVVVEGYHRIRRQQEKVIDLRGSDLELHQRIYLPSPLIKTPSNISIAASATNDIVCQILVPFVPLRVAPAVQAAHLLDAPNYESLKLSVQFADWKNVVTGGTNAPTWSAYGSPSGSPELRVYRNMAISPTKFAGFVPGRIFRYFNEVTGSIPTTTANGVRLFDVPRGFDIRAVLVKTGVKNTSATAGNNSFSSLSDFLTNLKFNVGLGKYIRYWPDGFGNYADYATSYNVSGDVTGLYVIDFCENGTLNDALNTRGLIGGPTGNVDTYVQADVAGASNQAIVAVYEEIRYRPIMAQ